jgi:hypothetical protein
MAENSKSGKETDIQIEEAQETDKSRETHYNQTAERLLKAKRKKVTNYT